MYTFDTENTFYNSIMKNLWFIWAIFFWHQH